MVRHNNRSNSSDDGDQRPVRRKQSKRTDRDGDDEASTNNLSGTIQVRNKMVRQLLYAKLKRSKSKSKLKERKARQQSDEPREEPKTIEKKRKRDETWVDENDQETLDDISNDELNSYFTRQADGTEPKLLLTSQEGFPTSFTNKFLKELARILPNTTYFQRRHHPIKRIIKKMNQLG
jgi:exopolysaccharide biosynthesis protein